MLPYGDDPSPARTKFPLFTILFFILNILVFIYQLSLGIDGAGDFVFRWGLVPEDFWSGQRVYTVLTSMFLHGGLLHIASNMLFLAIFGPNVEDQLGRRTFLVFYLVGGMMAALAYAIAFPSLEAPLVGASGAVAAVLGGYVLLFPRAMVRSLLFFGPFITAGRVAAVILIGFWFVLQVFESVVSILRLAEQENVAFLAHAVGFIYGVIAVGTIREGRDETVSHWDQGDERWWNRSFRNWILLGLFVVLGLGLSQFLTQAGYDALGWLVQIGMILLIGIIAVGDGIARLLGRRAILGSTQRAERAVAVIQIIAGMGIIGSIFVT